MGDQLPDSDYDSYGYDDMFDQQSFQARFHSVRSMAKPVRDLNKSYFRSSFTDVRGSVHEGMVADNIQQHSNFMARRPQTAKYVRGLPGSVSQSRFMTSYDNENFRDGLDTGYSNYVMRTSQFAPTRNTNAPSRGADWSSFNAGN
jgi:hypothetical protein